VSGATLRAGRGERGTKRGCAVWARERGRVSESESDTGSWSQSERGSWSQSEREVKPEPAFIPASEPMLMPRQRTRDEENTSDHETPGLQAEPMGDDQTPRRQLSRDGERARCGCGSEPGEARAWYGGGVRRGGLCVPGAVR
jgi:hypothetical protein